MRWDTQPIRKLSSSEISNESTGLLVSGRRIERVHKGQVNRSQNTSDEHLKPFYTQFAYALQHRPNEPP